MSRKKWTPKSEITPAVLKFREKRKWQIALRRYVLEQKWSAAYAPYFGIDTRRFREWIELQFEGGQTWENFSSRWQFDHIVPVAYFDFTEDAELRLCWNFTNIRVQAAAGRPAAEDGAAEAGTGAARTAESSPGRPFGIDVLGAKTYFQTLYTRTGYPVCRDMLEKIESLERVQLGDTKKQGVFLEKNMPFLTTISSFSEYEYAQLNEGVPLEVIIEGQAFSAMIQEDKH